MNRKITSRKMCVVLLTVYVLIGQGVVFGIQSADSLINRSDAWYRSPEAVRIAANILSFQADEGGWPKNIDTVSEPYAGDRASLKPTFDNRATTGELRFLARLYQLTKDERYGNAFSKGLDYIMKAQYPTGGWPQSYPPGKQYPRHITFNDNAMVRIMLFLQEITASDRYAFVDAGRKKAAQQAFDRGIECILKCQIKVDGRLTAWCAQHDELDYSPRPARTYELVSISGFESVNIVRLLMSLKTPRPEVVQSIEVAVAWFESSKLPGIKVEDIDKKDAPGGKDKVVADDPAAPPMWARFYEIGTNRPIFCDRDGVCRKSLAEIGHERRNGYVWLGYWPQDLLEKDYPAWKIRPAGR
ncbi:MAG: pectate lyase [Lentisphaerae bacterium GWF2_50_93]|nr:MAG: pectate lyase [Lentisphaerae bacterium GWF2_50_93]